MTFKGVVEGCVLTDAGPSGRARCRKESPSTIFKIFRRISSSSLFL